MAMAMPMRLDVRLRRLLRVVLALFNRVAMAMSFDVVLGRVLVLRLAMVLALRHSGSSCLLGEHENSTHDGSAHRNLPTCLHKCKNVMKWRRPLPPDRLHPRVP